MTEKFLSRERGALERGEREGKERGIISEKRERTWERGKMTRRGSEFVNFTRSRVKNKA